MKNLLRIEWVKTWNYTGFKVIIILHALLFLLVAFVISQVDITVPGFNVRKIYQFPNVWATFSWLATWFNILLGILFIVLTGNEYAYRTLRQQAIDGLSREELWTGKLVTILILALYGFMLVFISSLGFGLALSRSHHLSFFMDKIYLVFVYIIEAVGYMSLAFFIAVLFRSTGLAIVLFILYRIIIEPILRVIFPVEIRYFFPIKAISSLTPTPEFLSITSQGGFVQGGEELSLREMGILPEEPSLLISLALALGWTVIFLALSYVLIKRRDL